MTYSDYTLDDVTRLFGVTVEQADLFAALIPASTPAWLRDA